MATVASVRDRAVAAMVGAGLPDAAAEAAAAMRGLGLDPWLSGDRALSDGTAARVADAVVRRCRGEPLPYVLRWREFYGMRLAVAPGVFIPRPETEGVVSAAAGRLRLGDLACDLCTGSGAIALALARERQAHVDAVDLSSSAVAAATCNALRLGMRERVRVRRGDLWRGLPAARQGRYALCTCNPPYVTEAAWVNLPPEVRRWEPMIALVPPGGNVAAMYARIACGALAWLRRGGWLICEVGAGQATAAAEALGRAGLRAVGVRRDLAGIGRVVEGRRP